MFNRWWLDIHLLMSASTFTYVCCINYVHAMVYLFSFLSSFVVKNDIAHANLASGVLDLERCLFQYEEKTSKTRN